MLRRNFLQAILGAVAVPFLVKKERKPEVFIDYGKYAMASECRNRRYARDMARQIAAWYKPGMGIGIPTTKYPT